MPQEPLKPPKADDFLTVKTKQDLTAGDKVAIDRLLSEAETKKVMDEICIHFISIVKGPKKFAQALYEITQHPECPFTVRVRIFEIILNKRMQIEERTGGTDMAGMTKEDLEKEGLILMRRLRDGSRGGRYLKKYSDEELEAEIALRKTQREEEKEETLADTNQEKI